MTKTAKKFLETVKAECKSRGWTVILPNTQYIKLDAIRCSGFVDVDKKILKVAMGRKDGLEILVHEYSHFTQDRDQTTLWTSSFKSWGKLDQWLAGRPVRDIKKHITAIQVMELECEQRAVKHIRKYDLPIDINSYKTKANSYLYFYTNLLTTRRWSKPDNQPYTNPRILAVTPRKFSQDYMTMPTKLRKAFHDEQI